MKTLIFAIATSLILFSCTKEETQKSFASIDQPSWTGEYHSTGGDTASVGYINGFMKIRFAYKNTFALRCTFDSIHVNSDNTFSCNEYTTRENTNKVYYPETAVGNGKLSESNIEFTIAISGTSFTFKGMKK